MLRRLSFSTLLAAVALLVLTLPALAGGVVVTLDADPPRVVIDQPFEIGFSIFSMHDDNFPVSGETPYLSATNAATGETVSVTAVGDGTPGHYVATLALPSTGQWQWSIQPFGRGDIDYPVSEFTPITVIEASAGAAAPAATPLAAGQRLAVALAVALSLPLLMVWLRNRRLTRPSPAR